MKIILKIHNFYNKNNFAAIKKYRSANDALENFPKISELRLKIEIK